MWCTVVLLVEKLRILLSIPSVFLLFSFYSMTLLSVSDSDEEELVKNGADVKKNKQKKHAKASKADIKKER